GGSGFSGSGVGGFHGLGRISILRRGSGLVGRFGGGVHQRLLGISSRWLVGGNHFLRIGLRSLRGRGLGLRFERGGGGFSFLRLFFGKRRGLLNLDRNGFACWLKRRQSHIRRCDRRLRRRSGGWGFHGRLADRHDFVRHDRRRVTATT
ncbi:MAG: hypothetical protein WCO90_05860, partial [Planctomycetota bacterium]